MLQELWEAVDLSGFEKVLALLAIAWGIYVSFLQTATRKASLKRDAELAKALRDAEIKVPRSFVAELETGATELLVPDPRTIGMPHLVTITWGAFFTFTPIGAGLPWFAVLFSWALFGLPALYGGIGDLLWCKWHRIRHSRWGASFYKQNSVYMGETYAGLRARRRKVLERDRRLNRCDSYNAHGEPIES